MIWKAFAAGAAAFTGGVGVLQVTVSQGLWLLMAPGFLLVTWGVVHALTNGKGRGQT